MRHGVMRVDDVEGVGPRHVDDLGREREDVLRLAEQRVGGRLDRVHDDRPARVAQPERDLAAEDVDLVAAPREAHRQLGGDDAAAADGGVADDADAHPAASRRGRRHAAALTHAAPPPDPDRRPEVGRAEVGGPTVDRRRLEEVRPRHRLTDDEAFRVAHPGQSAELRVAALDQLREQRRRQARGCRRIAGRRELGAMTGERLALEVVDVAHVDDERRRRRVVDEVVEHPLGSPRLVGG